MRLLKKVKFKYWIILLLGLGMLVASRFLKFNNSNISTIQTNIITVSGIFAGFVIAYIAAKIFQIRSEREKLKIDINFLSAKLTNFRKLLYFVVGSDNFFVRRSDISKYERKYNKAGYESIHYNEGPNQDADKFWLEEKELSRTTIDIYLSIKAIIDDKNTTPLWIYDRDITFDYTLKQIQKYYEPSSQIWYYLEGRYEKHAKGLINDKDFNLSDVNRIRELASLIDQKFKNRDVDKNLIADLGNEFYEIYLPRLYELTEKIQLGLPKGLRLLVISISLIMLFGVILPLFACMFDFGACLNKILTMISGMSVIILFFNFFYDFINTIKFEILLKE